MFMVSAMTLKYLWYNHRRKCRGRERMKVAICDDEKEMRDILAGKVQKRYPSAEISCYKSGEELLSPGEDVDILFLDIQMPGLDGMETARRFRRNHKSTILIFVTAMEEYVFQAFDVGAFHYLVKPFSDEKFAAVLCRAVEQYRQSENGMTERQVGNPAQNTEESRNRRKREDKYMMIKTKGMHIKVPLKDILYAEVFNRKIILHTTDGDIEYYGKMSELAKLAGEDFFRSHRAYLVHFKYVERYNATTIYLERGTALMAKQNYPLFVKSYLKYNQRRGNEL